MRSRYKYLIVILVLSMPFSAQIVFETQSFPNSVALFGNGSLQQTGWPNNSKGSVAGIAHKLGRNLTFSNQQNSHKYSSSPFTTYLGGLPGYESIALSHVQIPGSDYLLVGGKTSNSDGYIIRLDAAGNYKWTKKLHTVNFSQIIPTSDGNYALVSAESSSGPIEWRPMLLKMDANANVLWTKKYQFLSGVDAIPPNLYWTNRTGLIQTSDNGFAINCVKSDTSKNVFTVASFTFTSVTYHINLIKTDFNGNMQWYKNYMFNYTNPFHIETMDPEGTVQTPDGGFLLVGGTSAISNFTKGFIIKTDNLGNVQWSNIYTPDGQFNSQSNFRSIHKLSSGDYIIAGESYDNTTALSPCIVVLCINSSGAIIWSRKYNPGGLGNFIYYGNSVIESGGNLFLLGAMRNTTGTAYRPLISKLDLSGNVIWTKVYGSFTVLSNQSQILAEDLTGNISFAGSDISTNKAYFINIDPITGTTNGCFYSDSTIVNVSSNISPTIIPTPVLSRNGTSQQTITKIPSGICNAVCGAVFPTFSLTPITSTICIGQSSTITAIGNAASYSWSPSSGLSTTSGTQVVATPTITTSYIVTGYDAGGVGCKTYSSTVYINPCPLPIELLEFKAIPVDNSVKLFWSTASESNNNYFEVQRSFDAVHFSSLGKVPGTGNSNTTQSYHYSDNAPLNGISYYRLKQVDFDGSFKYSSIVAVNFNAPLNSSIQIYPNPASGIFNVINEVYSSVKIIDALGRVLFHASLVNGHNIINLGSLQDGIYSAIFSDQNSETTLTKKIIKNNN